MTDCRCPSTGGIAYDCPRHGLKEPGASKSQRTIKSSRSNSSLARSETLKPGRRPRRQGIGQELKDAKWAGIREATIYWLNKLDPDGARCFECGRHSGGGYRLDLDHVQARGDGGHYSVSNAQLLCRHVSGTKGCHVSKHGNAPKWTEEAS